MEEKVTVEKKVTKEFPVKPSKQVQEAESLTLKKEYLNLHLEEITRLLSENLYYPRSARKRGITGVVHIRCSLSSSGEVHSLEVIESKNGILSKAAIETINNLNGKFPKPSKKITFRIPIEYSLKK